ncbi:MAG: DNA polymerase III subunit gamma/tau [Bacteroidales bacterium]|nr:DNA polymerase III subunit gamma/tau [Bacteroidales bacterium]
MSDYVVSARKYRPDSFESLIGQDNIARTLKNSIQRGQLAHAYLFCGPRGVGKTSAARIFAKTINCSNPGPDLEPCGECDSCRSFAEGRSYCIHELDAASNNGVEDIKTLMDQVQIPPQVGRYSVYIIDEVHMLSQSAFNAFLKTLEEPPAHAIFILATTEKHKILPTILSRCQTYDFNRIGVPDIVRNLRGIAGKEGITVDDESLHVIAHKADGAMRDALTLFDQTVAFCGTDIHYEDVIRNLGVLDYEYSFRLVDAFLAGDYASALLAFDEILAKGFNALHFVSALSAHLRDLLVSRTGGLESLLDLPDSLRARYKEQGERCSVKWLYDALGITSQCEAGYRLSTNPRLHIEFALMKLAFLQNAPAQATGSVQTTASTQAGTASSLRAGAPRQNFALRAHPSQPDGWAPPVHEATGGHDSAGVPGSSAPAVPAEKSAAGLGRLRSEEAVATPTEQAAPETSAPVEQAVPATASVRPDDNADRTVVSDGGRSASVPEAAPAPAKRRMKSGASLSLSALLSDDEPDVVQPAKEAAGAVAAPEAFPADEELAAKWKELAAMYGSQPRLANALANAKLTFREEEGRKVVDFTVTNEAQKKWIEERILRDLEARYARLTACGRIRLEPSVLPEEEQGPRIYMPAEKAEDLMSKNEEVRNLVVDLGLDIK